MLDLTGQTLSGRYRIEALIGRGGMAEVYRAWDTWRNYFVAVKVMREDLAEDYEFVQRFQRESEALSRLAHENIVRFYSFERDGRLAFIVMDYVEGTTLRGRILDAAGQPLPVAETIDIVRQVSSALHYAHMENVLHRDVKPGNIMIRPDGTVLVTDFGIAKAADSATATTVMPGTPAYMSPEQCRSEPLDVRTDVYSLGIVTYEMLGGRRPFVGDSPEANTGSTREKLRWEQMHAAPPSLTALNPDVMPELEAAVFRALAKDPAHRWPEVLRYWQALDKETGISACEKSGIGSKCQIPLEATVAVPPFMGSSSSSEPAEESGEEPIHGSGLPEKLENTTPEAGRRKIRPLNRFRERSEEVSTSNGELEDSPGGKRWSVTGQVMRGSFFIVSILTMAFIIVFIIGASLEYLYQSYPEIDYLALSSDGMLASFSDEFVSLWDLSTGERTDFQHDSWAHSPIGIFSPDGESLGIADRNAQEVKLVRTGDQKTLMRFEAPRADNIDDIADIVFSTDGNVLGTATRKGSIGLFKASNGELVTSWETGHRSNDISFSPDGQILALATDRGVYLYDVENGEVLGADVLQGNTITFSPDGRILASASDDGLVRLWSISNVGLQIEGVLGGHEHGVSNLKFSENGGKLNTVSGTGTVRVWDIAEEHLDMVFAEHQQTPHASAFSPDGRLVAFASGRNIQLWSIETGEATKEFKLPFAALMALLN